jgi:hypothetical protein
MNLGDYGASVVRTVVSYIYGLAITALLQWWTSVPSELAEWLGSDVTIGAVVAIATAAWYALFRALEPRLPNWLTRLTLGSAKSPDHYTLAA